MGVLLAAALLSATACGSRENRRIHAGKDLFSRSCARCHGMPGEEPPRVEGLETRPPDLTRLVERYGAPLPRERLARFIDGREDVAAHGSRDMPVWGEELYQQFPESGGGLEAARAGAIEVLLDYLESVQASAS